MSSTTAGTVTERVLMSMKQKETFAPGAPPSDGFVPLAVPEIRGNEWQYVKECLDTAWVSSVGSYVDRFEQMVAEQSGTRFAVATVNGTSALHISLLLAGVEADDEVLVSTLTFIAPGKRNPICGRLAGIHRRRAGLLADGSRPGCGFSGAGMSLERGRLYNRHTGRRVKAILPVHVLGHPVDIDPDRGSSAEIRSSCHRGCYGGSGGQLQGTTAGRSGDVGCFSFNGNKIITTGGGGMLVTITRKWARRARYLTTQAKDDPIEYIHGEVGYNYRLTNLLAAVGCAQMEQLPAYVAAKRKIAARYTEAPRYTRSCADEERSLGCEYLLDVHRPGRRRELWHGLAP